MNQRPQKAMQETILPFLEPPSSPLTTQRLTINIATPTRQQLRKRTTERSSPLEGTLYSSSFQRLQMTAMTQGRPRPRKTLTELEPVTFPTAASAQALSLAAVMLAKVSGSEVPMATNVIAVTPGFSPITHPIAPAISPTTAVSAPIKAMAARKQGMPPPQCGGGQQAKRTFHPTEKKWRAASTPLMSSISPSSFLEGWRRQAFLNCWPQVILSSRLIFSSSQVKASACFLRSTSVTSSMTAVSFLEIFTAAGYASKSLRPRSSSRSSLSSSER